MSDFRVNSITNQDGSAGPQVCGVSTFSGKSGVQIPSGSTDSRRLDGGGRGRAVFAGGEDPSANVDTIDYVEFIISETIAYINNLPDDNNLVYSKSKLIEELSNTSNGLDNLKSTYKIDNIITSRIDILKEKINNMCNK